MRIRASRSRLLLLLIAAAGCSSSNPASPSPEVDPDQFLRPGSYRLLVLSIPQRMAECTGASAPNPFFAIAAVVTVRRDGETWTARSTTDADGNLELRLRRAGDSPGTNNPVLLINVEGSGRGTAMTTLVGGSTTQSVSFGGTAGESRLEGRALFQGSAQGTAAGTLSVNSALFGTFECPAASWTLIPAAPG